MKKDVKERWVAALRSGDYKQGRKRLRTLEDSFCCLGVLCDVVHPDVWVKREDDDCYAIQEGNSPHSHFSGYIPINLADELGIDDSQQSVLVQMNDCKKKSFAEIADYIEKTPMSLSEEA